MDVSLDEINSANNCLIIAPAGCGKTETIVNLIKRNMTKKKCLILTHTNAGVETIINRLKKNGIEITKYSIYTIASFCSIYVRSFPKLANFTKFEEDSLDYSKLYTGMKTLLNNKHIKNILSNTYEVVYIDEYQDCTKKQHEMIKNLSQVVICKLFGDPLQAIYNFNKDESIGFDKIEEDGFLFIGHLTYPWRWERHNKELGKWIMHTRESLIKNEKICLTNLPDYIKIIKSSDSNTDFISTCYKEKDIEIMALFKVKQRANYMCQRMRGIYTLQEEIECKDLKESLNKIDNNFSSQNLLIETINIAEKCFIRFKKEFTTVKNKIEANNYTVSRKIKNLNILKICEELSKNFDFNKCQSLISLIENNSNIILYRREMWNEFKSVVKSKITNESISLVESLNNQRSKIENIKKYRYKKMFSRVLLVKGLEYSSVIIHDVQTLTKEEFYVAISRPTNKLIITTDRDYLQFI